MYDLGDFGKSYDAKKQAENTRIPQFPGVDGTFGLLLKRVKQDKSPKGKQLFQYSFQVTKSSTDLVLQGATYTLAFFPGADDVSRDQCWRNMLPVLMSASGESDVLTFNAVKALGDFLTLSLETDLDLPLQLSRKMEACKADKKTGIVKHVNQDGSAKIFPQDQFQPAPAPATAAQ